MSEVEASKANVEYCQSDKRAGAGAGSATEAHRYCRTRRIFPERREHEAWATALISVVHFKSAAFGSYPLERPGAGLTGSYARVTASRFGHALALGRRGLVGYRSAC